MSSHSSLAVQRDMSRNLVRHRASGKVEVIHLAGCSHASPKSLPWNWAEGRDPREWLELGWFRPCKVCLPQLQNYYPCCGEFGGCGGPCPRRFRAGS